MARSGQISERFRDYIAPRPELSNGSGETARETRGVPHAAAGAALALERLGQDTLSGLLVALTIEAHHGASKPLRDIPQTVERRGTELLRRARQGGLPSELEQEGPIFTGKPSALAVRMLFSALVDADLLNTEAWDTGVGRPERGDSPKPLRGRLDTFCIGKIEQARAGALSDAERALSRMRQQV